MNQAQILFYLKHNLLWSGSISNELYCRIEKYSFKAAWSSFDMTQLWEALGWAEPAAAVGVENSKGSGLPGDQGMEAVSGWSFSHQERGTRSSSVSFHFILTWNLQWKSYCSLLCVKSLLEILEICLHRLCMARGPFLHPTTHGVTHSRLGSRYMGVLQPRHFTCGWGWVSYPLRARFLSLQHSSECLLCSLWGVWWQSYKTTHVRIPFVNYKASNECKPGLLYIKPLAHTWRDGSDTKKE